MDDNHPVLKRPKKKLMYPATKTRLPSLLALDIVSLEDVGKMFDDLDSEGEDFPSPSPEILIPKPAEEVVSRVPPSCPSSPKAMIGDHNCLLPVRAEFDIDSESPFKAHGPVKTSSPIDGNELQHKRKQRKKDNSAFPILFDCEENQDLEMAEKLKSDKTPHDNRRRDESDDSFFETLPKPSSYDKISTHKKKTAPARLKLSSPRVSPLRLMVPTEKQTESAPTRVKHNLTSFLQKLRDARQPKPAFAGLQRAKVMHPAPESEPEDNFLILEDDAPLYISIPSKSTKSLKEKQSKTSSSDKETKDTADEENSTDKPQGIEEYHKKQEGQALTEKTKKKTKGKASESDSASDKDQNIAVTVDAENLVGHGKIGKKKTQIKKSLSKYNEQVTVDKGTHTDTGNSAKKTKMEGKTLKNITGNSQRKSTPAKEMRKKASKAETVGAVKHSQELFCDNQLTDDSPFTGIDNLEAKAAGELDEHLKPPCISVGGTSEEGDRVLGKRKRKPTGQWWMSCSQSSQEPTDKLSTVKKAKHTKKDSSASPVKGNRNTRKTNLKASSSSDGQRQKAEKKKGKKGTQKRARLIKRSKDSDGVFPELSQDIAVEQDSDSSPFILPHREHIISSGEQVFPKVNKKDASENPSIPDHISTAKFERQLGSRKSTKRRQKSSGNCCQINPTPDETEVPPLNNQRCPPQQQKPKKNRAAVQKKTLSKRLSVRSPSKPLEGATKPTKRSLFTLSDLFSHVNLPSPEDALMAHYVETDEYQRTQEQSQSHVTIQEYMSKVIHSGPSSMIGFENYDRDYENIAFPSTSGLPALCTSDLCAPPLRPLVLEPQDKEYLHNWFKSVWPDLNKYAGNIDVAPDDFVWYSYQDRAFGLIVDLHLGSVCNGKMVLGSFMKKPLWVDHSATTVFNLLTGIVNLIVDCKKFCYGASQSFMVPPGHAYSIHNLGAQPAIFYFTRVYAEESDE